jgi:hypothetical protein
MALSDILSHLITPAMFTINGGIDAASLKISKVNIKYTSKPMRHMKEDGSTIVDARIIQPVHVEVEGFCPDLDTQNQVNNIMLNRDILYNIDSKGLHIRNMMLEGETVSQTSQVLSAAPVKLSFKEVLVRNVIPIVTGQSGDASLVDHGMSAVKDAGDAARHYIITVGLPGQPFR